MTVKPPQLSSFMALVYSSKNVCLHNETSLWERERERAISTMLVIPVVDAESRANADDMPLHLQAIDESLKIITWRVGSISVKSLATPYSDKAVNSPYLVGIMHWYEHTSGILLLAFYGMSYFLMTLSSVGDDYESRLRLFETKLMSPPICRGDS